MTPGHRFLLVRLGALGDIVHAMPVAAALRARFPGARIDWMAHPRYADLLHLVTAVDGVVPVDPRRGWSTLGSTIRDLRRVGYDAAIDLQGLLKSAVLARAAGAARTIGFRRGEARESPAVLFYSDTPATGDAAHVIRKNLALLAPLGVRDAGITFPIDVPRTPAADRLQADLGGERFALLAVGAGWPNKCWPPDRFGALAHAIRARHGLRSLVLWGPGEEPLAAAVVAASDGAAAPAPQTSVAELVVLARAAALVVGGDTGPLHLAAAAGTPAVALFGPSRPERNGPWLDADIVIWRTNECVCLYQRRCRRGRPCIEEIPVDEVAHAVERRLQQGAGGAPE